MTTAREFPDTYDEVIDDPRNFKPAGAADAALPYVDLARDPIPERQWLVPDRIPMRNVSMLSGEGSIGKSLLLMQLSGAVVLGKDWIGTLPEPGPVLYMSCEEDDDEVRRRMEAVAKHLSSTRQEMIEHGLHFLSFAGRDAVLGQADRFGIIRPTPLFERLRRDALELHPKLIALDTVADVFAGKEIDRAQTRQFITMQRGLAIDAGSAVVMSAHPSLTGISTDTGLSGSTGWHNSVRARMYFKPAPGDDTALRVLEVKKNNYGPVNESIVLRWRDGVYVVEPGKGTLDRLAAEAEIDHLFMKLLRRFTEQGRNVSDRRSPTYAPSVFSEEPEATAAKATKKALAEAMIRLFAAGKIAVAKEGRASHQTHRIVEKEGPANGRPTPGQHPANTRPTGGGYTPLCPPASWPGPRGRWLRPAPGQREARERRAGERPRRRTGNVVVRNRARRIPRNRRSKEHERTKHPTGRRLLRSLPALPRERRLHQRRRSHWFVCHEHKVKWCVGSNLFSGWRAKRYPRLVAYLETDEGKHWQWKRSASIP
jgi:RecA-family ATPase